MCIYICALVWTVAHQASQSRAFPRQGYWNGLPFPSPGIFLTQGSNPGLLHYRKILYCWATRVLRFMGSQRVMTERLIWSDIYIYTRIYTHVYIHTHICIYITHTHTHTYIYINTYGLPWWLSDEESAAIQELQVQSLGREDPHGREWQPAPVFLPLKSHGPRSLAGYTWGRKESDMTEQVDNNNI